MLKTAFEQDDSRMTSASEDDRTLPLPGIITTLQMPLSAEEKELQLIRDRVIELDRKFDYVSLVRSIRQLQDASRVQEVPKELQGGLLSEIRRRKLMLEIVQRELL